MAKSNTIAKNTLFLYLRMLLTMSVSLYSSRIVLQVLGVEDYGIYSIVGGVVTLFAFFNYAMSSATQRFLAYDIGRGDERQLRNTFNATFFIHIGVAILILILAETFGLWFVNHKLNVPINRIDAVLWIYQFSVFTLLIGVVQVPFNALIIARERMNVYALLSVAEVILKLIVVYLLILFDFDKLKLYAVLIFIVSLLVALFYRIYCRRNFKETKFRWYYDKQYFKTLIAYSGWNLFGNIAGVAKGQGVNIILNIFFGVVLNAAYGIMTQVQGAVNTFVTNFQLAVNPQIIKSYAANDKDRMMKLIFQSSKLSYFLMLAITVPIIFNINFVLLLWLKNPPNYTASFVKLCLINILIDCISGPLMTGAQATGQVKWYQIIIGSFIFLNLPVSYFLLLNFDHPDLPLYAGIFITIFSLVFRLFFLKKMMEFDSLKFVREVLFKIILVSVTIILILYLTSQFFGIQEGYVKILFSILVTFALIIFLGLTKSETHELKILLLKRTK